MLIHYLVSNAKNIPYKFAKLVPLLEEQLPNTYIIYVYIYISIYISIHTHAYICIYAYVYMCISVPLYICTQKHMHVYIHKLSKICVWLWLLPDFESYLSPLPSTWFSTNGFLFQASDSSFIPWCANSSLVSLSALTIYSSKRLNCTSVTHLAMDMNWTE